MTAYPAGEKTAVFTPCADDMEATRAFPAIEEDTRELPLIADRFVGRYWDGRMEARPENNPERKICRPAAGLAAAAAVLVLVGSWIGQPVRTADLHEIPAEQIAECSDRATVLNLRRGGELRRTWESLLDSLTDWL